MPDEIKEDTPAGMAAKKQDLLKKNLLEYRFILSIDSSYWN
jgi:hypothetical protein